jgi:hypothetical protein
VKVVLIANIVKQSFILNISFYLSRNVIIKIYLSYRHLNGTSKMWVRVSPLAGGYRQLRVVLRMCHRFFHMDNPVSNFIDGRSHILKLYPWKPSPAIGIIPPFPRPQ